MSDLAQAVRDAIESLKTPSPREIISEQLQRALDTSQFCPDIVRLSEEWYANARKHIAAANEDDCEVGGDDWMLHAESARTYRRCADQLVSILSQSRPVAQTVPGDRAFEHIAEVANYGAKKLNEIDPAYVTPKVAGAINTAVERFWLIARTAKASALPSTDSPAQTASEQSILLDLAAKFRKEHSSVFSGNNVATALAEAASALPSTDSPAQAPTEAQIERGAKAMCEWMHGVGSWDTRSSQRDHFVGQMRAALSALPSTDHSGATK